MLALPSRARRLVAPALLVLAALAGCHTFPTDPNETRWEPPPSQFPMTYLSGRVFRQGSSTPVAGVRVSGGNSSAVSDTNGFYALDGYRASQMLLVATKDGFDTLSVSLVLNGNNQTYNVFLRPR
jgi:hypothetical protein